MLISGAVTRPSHLMVPVCADLTKQGMSVPFAGDSPVLYYHAQPKFRAVNSWSRIKTENLPL
jgi:hypothetical protein